MTIVVSAVTLVFVSSVASNSDKSALSALQLLWVYLIVDPLVAIALAIDSPRSEVLTRKPEQRSASLISFDMWKMIIGQGCLQLVITLVLNFAGTRIFPTWDQDHLDTMVFNTFVWLQVFNALNCRRVDNKLNIFSGFTLSSLALLVIICGCQILIVFVPKKPFSITQINGVQWAVSVTMGLLSLPFGALIRLCPETFIRRFTPPIFFRFRSRPPIDEESGSLDDNEWNPRIGKEEHDRLSLIKTVRSKIRLGSLGKP